MAVSPGCNLAASSQTSSLWGTQRCKRTCRPEPRPSSRHPGGHARLGTGGLARRAREAAGFYDQTKERRPGVGASTPVPRTPGAVGAAYLSQGGDMLRHREEQARSTGQEAKPQTRWRQTDGWPCACPGSCRRAPGPGLSVHRRVSLSARLWSLKRVSQDLPKLL